MQERPGDELDDHLQTDDQQVDRQERSQLGQDLCTARRAVEAGHHRQRHHLPEEAYEVGDSTHRQRGQQVVAEGTPELALGEPPGSLHPFDATELLDRNSGNRVQQLGLDVDAERDQQDNEKEDPTDEPQGCSAARTAAPRSRHCGSHSQRDHRAVDQGESTDGNENHRRQAHQEAPGPLEEAGQVRPRALGDLVGGDGHHGLALQLDEYRRDDTDDHHTGAGKDADRYGSTTQVRGVRDQPCTEDNRNPRADKHGRGDQRQDGDQHEQSEALFQGLEGPGEHAGDVEGTGTEHGRRGEHRLSVLLRTPEDSVIQGSVRERPQETTRGTLPVSFRKPHMNLCAPSAVGSNISGQPPSITTTPCSRP